MELSGFGIFIALTWILGNLILTPVGWVVIPVVIAIAIAYREKLKKERLERLRHQLDELQRQLDDGDITQEQFEAARDEAIQEILA
jgi:cytochrome c-type biogenesis protein CcmH/NrfG